MPQHSLPIRVYAIGASFSVSAEDPYNDRWYCWTQRRWVAANMVQQRRLPLTASTDPAYRTVAQADVDVTAWPNGRYVLYLHNAEAADNVVVAAPVTVEVVAGSAQYAAPVGLGVGANLDLTDRDTGHKTRLSITANANVAQRY